MTVMVLLTASNGEVPWSDTSYRLEFLPEVQEDVTRLDEAVRRVVADIVVSLHHNPWLGDSMDTRWPQNLEGYRKVRFKPAVRL